MVPKVKVKEPVDQVSPGTKALMKMFGTEDQTIELVWDETEEIFWLYHFDHFKAGKPMYSNHEIHKMRMFHNGISENDVAGRFWQYAKALEEQTGEVIPFGKLPAMLKHVGVVIKPTSAYKE